MCACDLPLTYDQPGAGLVATHSLQVKKKDIFRQRTFLLHILPFGGQNNPVDK